MKTWVKLYTEIIDDNKLRPFTWAERGILMTLIALAGRLDYRDEKENETGRLDTLQDIVWYLRCDIEELQEAVQKFIKCGMLEDWDGVLYVANYAKRQKRAPSSRRDAVSDRVKRHREKKQGESNEDVTTLQPDGNEDVTQLDKTRLERVDAEAESESDVTAATSASFSAWLDAKNNYMTQLDTDQLADLITEYSDEWVAASICEANKSKRGGGISFKFIEAILARWKKEGFQSVQFPEKEVKDVIWINT